MTSHSNNTSAALCPYCRSPDHSEDTTPCPRRVLDVHRFVAGGKLYAGEVVEIKRACGEVKCSCGLSYYNHPPLMTTFNPHVDWSWVTVICDGSLVKL